MDLDLLKPNAPSFGYGLSLAISATTIWGGALPMLPLEMQTFGLLVTLFVVQSISLVGTFAACMICSYLFPNAIRRMSVSICTLILLSGSVCLIAPLYLPRFLNLLVTIGAILLGTGTASFLVLWQCFFSSQDVDEGNLNLIKGTGYSAIIFAILHIIPMAVAALMIALIFIPLAGLCLTLSTKQTDYHQPMFDDVPKTSPHVYRQVVQNRWKAALCTGCFGLVSGMARALALSDPSMSLIVNSASMTGSLISSLVLVVLWQRFSFRFDPVLAFRSIFPAIATLLLLLPFIGPGFLRLFAGLMYMLFTFATMIMMIQCAQTSRDYGVNPAFIFGLFGVIVYALQSSGFLFAYLYVPAESTEKLHLAILALVAVWTLALTLYLVKGHLRLQETNMQSQIRAGSVEFIALDPPRSADRGKREMTHNAKGAETPVAASKPEFSARVKLKGGARESREPQYQDRISRQCALLGKHYRLTAREIEVMELIARGNSVAYIAELLVVSENTIRTHCKRFYAKLNIHKRQDLLALLSEIE